MGVKRNLVPQSSHSSLRDIFSHWIKLEHMTVNSENIEDVTHDLTNRRERIECFHGTGMDRTVADRVHLRIGKRGRYPHLERRSVNEYIIPHETCLPDRFRCSLHWPS